jgi:hypothetical protein
VSEVALQRARGLYDQRAALIWSILGPSRPGELFWETALAAGRLVDNVGIV